MIDTFKISYKLRNTYRVNSIIYSLKSIPVIKKMLPEALYGSRGLKVFANVLSVIYEILTFFLGKILYMALMVYIMSGLMKAPRQDAYIHIFFFLTIVGGILNTSMFNPTRDKYYSIILMRMDARKATLSGFFYYIFKTILGFLPVAVFFALLTDVKIYVALLMPFFVASMKFIFVAMALGTPGKKEKKFRNENTPGIIATVAVIALLAAAYLLPFLGYAITTPIFVIAAGITIAWGGYSLVKIVRFTDYRGMCKELLAGNSFLANGKQQMAAVTQDSYLKKLDLSTELTSNKSGYEYFNEIFMKRHSRLLTKSAKRYAVAELIIFLVAIAACICFPDIKKEINGLMLTFLPYFLFVMYFVNRGKNITEAMFMNCDHSMLTYRFYRQPKVILRLFTARLKYIILINLIPGSVIALGLPFLLYVTGGTDQPMNYVVLFVSIVAMSIFFSVHNMVLYYLLQPYNVELEMKNATYSIINSITYIVCYVAIGKRVPTMMFGSLVTAFCIIYVVVALILAYRLAPKTFKLR